MFVIDAIYGYTEISEPVLVELINTAAMQRLKKVNEASKLANFKISYVRYEHCVGVMLLLRMFGASVEEQTAGLLHDVSHAAFSHAIDRMMGSSDKQDYQDNVHADFIKRSAIPAILEMHGMDPDRVIDIKSHGLLEREIPDICADRIDYALRNFKAWENPRAVAPSLSGLAVREGRFVFKSKEAALIFANNYLTCQVTSWGLLENNVREHVFSKMLLAAIDKKVITFDDMYTDDEYVIDRITKSTDRDIKLMLSVLDGKLRYHVVDEGEDTVIKIKYRYTDPLYLDGSGMRRISSADSEFKARIESYKTPTQYGIRFDYAPDIVRLLA